MNYYTVEKFSMLYGLSLKLYGFPLKVCMNCVPGILRLTINADIFKTIFLKSDLSEDNDTLTKKHCLYSKYTLAPYFFKNMFCGIKNKIFPLSV